jgi:hypothetical protein
MDKLHPLELAKQEKKTIIGRIIGPMVGVYYPYRKSGDLYIVPDDKTFHCCQDCDKDFPITEFIEHVNSHNKQLKRYPDFIIDPGLIEKE